MKIIQFTKFFLLLALFSICNLYLLSCSPAYPTTEESNEIKVQPEVPPEAEENMLRVGVSSNAPPLIYREGTRITGLEADLANKFGAFLGKKVQFIEVPWKEQISYLEQGKTDIIMSGMTITLSRQYRIHFTTPYLRAGQIMLVRLQDKNLFSTGVYSLMNSNHIIGTVNGTTGDLFITKTILGVDIKRFQTSTAAVDALIQKDIDALVYDAPMVCYYAAINESNKLTPILHLATEEFLAWGIRKSDNDLLNQANTFLAEFSKDGRLQQLTRKWIPYM